MRSSGFLVEAMPTPGAVGSLMIRSTLSPAILPGILRGLALASSKQAGTVTTASVTFFSEIVFGRLPYLLQNHGETSGGL